MPMWPRLPTDSISYSGQRSVFWDTVFSELCGKRSSLCLDKSVASDGPFASVK